MPVTRASGRPAARPRRTGARVVHAEMLEVQRPRLINAVISLVEDGGIQALTASNVVARAHLSRKTFYELFSNVEDAFLAALEQTVEFGRTLAHDAYARESDWRSGTRAALHELLTAMEERRPLARVCLVDALVAGPRVWELHARVVAELGQALDRGRAVAGSGYRPPLLTAQATVGAITSLLHTRLLREDPQPLTDLLGPMMSMIVLPYLGAAAAHQECTAPTAPRKREPAPDPSPADHRPLTQPRMRITYRTVRVLSAIAANPGASNRHVAMEAGVLDPGQISKLLARLARLGLVENHRSGLAYGENAWHLTDSGARLETSTTGVRLGA